MALHPRRFYSELPSVISLIFYQWFCNIALTLVTYLSAFFNHLLLVFLIIMYVWETGRRTWGNEVTSLALCTQARRKAEAQLEAEWQEMINGIDRLAWLQESQLTRKQR